MNIMRLIFLPAFFLPIIKNSSNVSINYSSNIFANQVEEINKLSSGSRNLQVAGNTLFNTIEVGRPQGRPYILEDCSSTASGTIDFTSTGEFISNTYTAILSDRNGYFSNPDTIGTLISDANSGTINITIPAGTNRGGNYEIRVISNNPAVSGSSGLFEIFGAYCHSESSDLYRCVASGDWSQVNIWESTLKYENEWIPATRIPDYGATNISIGPGKTVTVTTSVSIGNANLTGTLRLLNGDENNGHITLYYPGAEHYFSLRITGDSGTLQVVSSDDSYSDAITYSGGNIVVDFGGKIIIGDGSSINAPGYHGFATGPSSQVGWYGGVFEWNSSNSTFPPISNATYFPNSPGHATFRLTTVPGGTFGGSGNTTINGFIEINTPVTAIGAGTKTFVDGIKGSSTLTQGGGSGIFQTISPYTIIPPTPETPGTVIGLIDGTIELHLTSGLTFMNGITIPSGANVRISGQCQSFGKFDLQTGANLTLDSGAVLTVNN